jgi:hypothetical protein
MATLYRIAISVVALKVLLLVEFEPVGCPAILLVILVEEADDLRVPCCDCDRELDVEYLYRK